MAATGVRLLPSGKHQARFRYRGRDYTEVWDTEKQAAAWIQRTRGELKAGTYAGPHGSIDPETARPLPPTLAGYFPVWLADRKLKPRSRSDYGKWSRHFLPQLGKYRVDQLTREQCKAWYRGLDLPPTMKSRVYELLRAVLNTAVDDEHMASNPCRIRGAGSVKRQSATELPTPFEVHAMADAMSGPSDPIRKYRTMTLVAAWCGLRFGELTELRRKDLVLNNGQPVVVRVRRAVVRVDGRVIVGVPKSAAGVRDVTIPPHIRQDLAAYLEHVGASLGSLLFPSVAGAHLNPSTLAKPWYRVREESGFPNLHWHDLRGFAGTSAAQAGATLAEVQARLGHSTVAAAMRYQHVVAGRDVALADSLSATVIPLRAGPGAQD